MYLDFLYEPFNIDTHKANAHKIDAFEAMIAPDGTVEYAMPSHQEFLIKKAALIKSLTQQELEDSCPKEYYGDYMHWLMIQSGGYIPVWDRFYLAYEPITVEQRNSLKKLKMHGIYLGKI